ncbi:MAG: hypothetical protein GWN00_05365 [Aliifodinibius sp.]|nr:hypothetical protein [Fodinibius sp.]NIV10644.1 hypothetical protein [Fodinibius sp.]NIY24257.1 hypothetical protein [Fodinibius sp.]
MSDVVATALMDESAGAKPENPLQLGADSVNGISGSAVIIRIQIESNLIVILHIQICANLNPHKKVISIIGDTELAKINVADLLIA